MAYFKLVLLRAGALLCHIDLLGSSRIQARRYLGGAAASAALGWAAFWLSWSRILTE
jgi:hypothetical protein